MELGPLNFSEKEITESNNETRHTSTSQHSIAFEEVPEKVNDTTEEYSSSQLFMVKERDQENSQSEPYQTIAETIQADESLLAAPEVIETVSSIPTETIIIDEIEERKIETKQANDIQEDHLIDNHSEEISVTHQAAVESEIIASNESSSYSASPIMEEAVNSTTTSIPIVIEQESTEITEEKDIIIPETTPEKTPIADDKIPDPDAKIAYDQVFSANYHVLGFDEFPSREEYHEISNDDRSHFDTVIESSDDIHHEKRITIDDNEAPETIEENNTVKSIPHVTTDNISVKQDDSYTALSPLHGSTASEIFVPTQVRES